jgi:hypothetical protein
MLLPSNESEVERHMLSLDKHGLFQVQTLNHKPADHRLHQNSSTPTSYTELPTAQFTEGNMDTHLGGCAGSGHRVWQACARNLTCIQDMVQLGDREGGYDRPSALAMC